MTLEDIVLSEIKSEQQISPFFDDSGLKNYIKEGIYFLNKTAGEEIDFDEDLDARSLLKTYVFYANHKRLAEFMALYQGDYIELQARYYQHPDLP